VNNEADLIGNVKSGQEKFGKTSYSGLK
jgi:hypothetical protein